MPTTFQSLTHLTRSMLETLLTTFLFLGKLHHCESFVLAVERWYEGKLVSAFTHILFALSRSEHCSDHRRAALIENTAQCDVRRTMFQRASSLQFDFIYGQRQTLPESIITSIKVYEFLSVFDANFLPAVGFASSSWEIKSRKQMAFGRLLWHLMPIVCCNKVWRKIKKANFATNSSFILRCRSRLKNEQSSGSVREYLMSLFVFIPRGVFVMRG